MSQRKPSRTRLLPGFLRKDLADRGTTIVILVPAGNATAEPTVSVLADGPAHGNFDTMKTTIDHAGRLVIPKDIRRESGIKPGMPLEVRWEKGAIAITPSPLAVKLERKGRLLLAVSTKDTPRLSADTVERTRKVLRKERSGDSA